MSLCASRITLLLALDFSSCYAGDVSSFFHSLSTAAFASGIFIASLVCQIVMCHRVVSFARDEVFVLCRYRRFHSLSCGFMRLHRTTINRFWESLESNFLLCNHFRDASVNHPVGRHSWCHGSFQFSPRIFESFFVILMIRINEVNASRFSFRPDCNNTAEVHSFTLRTALSAIPICF